MDKTIVYPLPKTSLIKFAHSVFTPLKNHLSVTCMFSAGGGKRTIFNLLLREEKIIKSIFEKSYDKTLIVYIDADEMLELSNIYYLQLILDSLIKAMRSKKIIPENDLMNNPLTAIKNNLIKITGKGFDVIFILNDFELTLSLSQSIYLNLETIRDVNKSKIIYLFLLTINLFQKEVLEKLHNLKYVASQNLIYFPIFSKEESMYSINKISKNLKTKLSENKKELIYELCGGHPQLLRYILLILSEKDPRDRISAANIKCYLLSHYRLKIVCVDIWSFLSDQEKKILNEVASLNKIQHSNSESAEYLRQLGLIKLDRNDRYKIFGAIFEEFIKNNLPSLSFTFDSKSKKLFLGGRSCEEKFTFQEFKLLSFFIMHENEVLSRDEVAQALWGVNYIEKYSDWSIDKTISTIRKKMDSLGFPSKNLITLKKRGFSFSNS